MPKSTYDGDSPNKKIARAYAWLYTVDLLKALGIEPKSALVLAGEGGDLSSLAGALEAKGFDSTKVIQRSTAVDFVPRCVEACVEKFGCNGRVGYAADAAPVVHPYNMSHMDFCNGITVENINTVAQVISNAHPGEPTYDPDQEPSFHLVTVLRGREGGPKKHNILVPKEIPRVLRRKCQLMLRKAHLKTHGTTNPAHRLMRNGTFSVKQGIMFQTEHIKRYLESDEGSHESKDIYFKKNGQLTPYGSGMARNRLFVDCLSVILAHKFVVTCLFQDAYHSQKTQKVGDGSPLVTFGLLVVPRILKDHECLRRAKKIEQIMKTHPMSGWNATFYHGSGAGYDHMKQQAIIVASEVGSKAAAKLFNVSTGTIAAWKAHATRGTYSGSKAAAKNSITPPATNDYATHH